MKGIWRKADIMKVTRIVTKTISSKLMKREQENSEEKRIVKKSEDMASWRIWRQSLCRNQISSWVAHVAAKRR